MFVRPTPEASNQNRFTRRATLAVAVGGLIAGTLKSFSRKRTPSERGGWSPLIIETTDEQQVVEPTELFPVPSIDPDAELLEKIS